MLGGEMDVESAVPQTVYVVTADDAPLGVFDLQDHARQFVERQNFQDAQARRLRNIEIRDFVLNAGLH